MRKQFKNKSEEFVYHYSKETFLSLWSYSNPLGKHPGHELCDILVVCDPDIIVISVKEISLPKGDVNHVTMERWKREAIDKSCKQIYGAVRYLKSAEYVTRSDGSRGLCLPAVDSCRIHRIAVALGGEGKVLLPSGDFGKGFIHVFDETSFSIVINELDTIIDFVEYLQAKEAFCESQDMILINEGEENILALYLSKGRLFPTGTNRLVTIEQGIWEEFSKSVQYRSKKQEDKVSYVWDNLIEFLTANLVEGDGGFGSSLSNIELSLRTMARECRLSRRMLGKGFADFIEKKTHIRSRILCSEISSVTYVFLAIPYEEGRQHRLEELEGRCYIARGMVPMNETVIGIATESSAPIKGFSLDIYYHYQKGWSEEDGLKIEELKKDTHFFERPELSASFEDEYPDPN